MFVDCSQISINAIVKHVQHVGFIWTSSLLGMDLLSFPVPGGGTEKIVGLFVCKVG